MVSKTDRKVFIWWSEIKGVYNSDFQILFQSPLRVLGAVDGR
jgi:hypothetical protein